MKLTVNKLMWDRLAIESIDFQPAHNTAYSGSREALVAKMQYKQYTYFMEWIPMVQYHLSLVVVDRAVRRILYART